MKAESKRQTFAAVNTVFRYRPMLEGTVKISNREGELEVKGDDLAIFMTHLLKDMALNAVGTWFDELMENFPRGKK